MATLETRARATLHEVRRLLAALYAPTLAASEAFVRVAYDRPWDEPRPQPRPAPKTRQATGLDERRQTLRA